MEAALQSAADADIMRRTVGGLFQPFSPSYVQDPARAFYLRAHAESRVAFSEAFHAFLVTGYAEVQQVLREPNVFSSARNLDPMVPLPDEVIDILRTGIYPLPPGLFNNDPPAHTRARALFSRAFTPARMANLEPFVLSTAADLVEGLARKGGTVNLMQELMYPLPMRIAAELVGIPYEDTPQLKSWQDDWFKTFDPTLDLAQKKAAAGSFVKYQRYYADLIERRRASPADDFLTALIRARVENEQPLSLEEIVSHLIILFFAGYETTASLMGSLMFRLLEDPALWEEIGHDTALLQSAIEETMRLDAPVQMEPRCTTASTTVGGVDIPAGSQVFTFFGGANCDERAFPEPLRFDPKRSGAHRHLGFGFGIHTCIGAPLARAEARISVQTLRNRFPKLRLAEGANRSYLPSLLFRTPAAVPVVLDDA